MKLSEHFSLAEFAFSHTAENLGIDNTPPPEAIVRMMTLCERVLEPLRAEVGKPVIVTSGYRCPSLNKAVRGDPNSQHMRGEAADIVIRGMKPFDVCMVIAHMFSFDQLIHEFGKWTHVSYVDDTRNRNEDLTIYLDERGRRVCVFGIVEV